jgi:hypothetical protein
MTEPKYNIGQTVTIDGQPGKIVGYEDGRNVWRIQGVYFSGTIYYVSIGGEWRAVPETGIVMKEKE